MKLSVVIPAHNEAGSVGADRRGRSRAALRAEAIPYEIVVVDDDSTDGTARRGGRAGRATSDVRGCRELARAGGFGYAVRAGLERFTGDAVAIMMADLSDYPRDLVLYYRLLEQGFDCAFGSRFMPGAVVIDYPQAQAAHQPGREPRHPGVFRHGYNDTTNAFKAYRREVIERSTRCSRRTST